MTIRTVMSRDLSRHWSYGSYEIFGRSAGVSASDHSARSVNYSQTGFQKQKSKEKKYRLRKFFERKFFASCVAMNTGSSPRLNANLDLDACQTDYLTLVILRGFSERFQGSARGASVLHRTLYNDKIYRKQNVCELRRQSN
jgi:hypothetical protein